MLATDPHPVDATYTLILVDPPGTTLRYDLRGVEASWSARADAPATWTSRWPTLVPPTKSDLPPGAGRLTLKTLAALPRGKGTLSMHASRPFELTLGNEQATAKPDPAGGWTAAATAEIELDATDVGATVVLDGSSDLVLTSRYVPASTQKQIPLTPASFTLPWAPPTAASVPESPVPDELISGGDPTRGAAVFAGNQAKCAVCHKVRGSGGDVGLI